MNRVCPQGTHSVMEDMKMENAIYKTSDIHRVIERQASRNRDKLPEWDYHSPKAKKALGKTHVLMNVWEKVLTMESGTRFSGDEAMVPVYVENAHNSMGEDFHDWLCPVCGEKVGELYVPMDHVQSEEQYCPECGQRIDCKAESQKAERAGAGVRKEKNMTTKRSLYCETGTFHYEPKEKNTHKKDAKRVAAYCRVSTLAEEQELSFETQTQYYSHLIENDPTLELVGVYGDQGFSGLHSDKRKEFQRLIADCETGKVDIVLVKSISRFSRNTIECLDYVQRLKEHNVTILFEKEGLNSMDPKMEMILSIYATMAQNESCSHSGNIRWSKMRRAEMGDPIRGTCYGYRAVKTPGKTARDWVIVEEEAERVRLIFQLASQGYLPGEILEKVNKLEAARGERLWTIHRVKGVLRNEAYRGDILTNKTVVLDYVSKKSIRNKGQVTQYYLEAHHPYIVEPELFDTVQDYMNKGYLSARNTLIREAWFKEHPEILERRKQYESENNAIAGC